jgi:hypothetical protein
MKFPSLEFVQALQEMWRVLRDGSRALGHLLDTGDIMIDGDLLQANRLYEPTHLMLSTVRDMKADP